MILIGSGLRPPRIPPSHHPLYWLQRADARRDSGPCDYSVLPRADFDLLSVGVADSARAAFGVPHHFAGVRHQLPIFRSYVLPMHVQAPTAGSVSCRRAPRWHLPCGVRVSAFPDGALLRAVPRCGAVIGTFTSRSCDGATRLESSCVRAFHLGFVALGISGDDVQACRRRVPMPRWLSTALSFDRRHAVDRRHTRLIAESAASERAPKTLIGVPRRPTLASIGLPALMGSS